MADDLHKASDLSDRGKPPVASNEDVDTKTARRELKQTYISEHDAKANPGPDANSPRSGSEEDMTVTPDSGHASPALGKTRLERAQHHPRQASSPKKKRARDEFDEQKEGDADPKKSSEEGSTSDEAHGTNTATATSATAASATRSGPATADSGGTSTQSRTDRLEPEKKRPRDHQEGDDRPREGTSINIMASPTKPSDTEGKNRPLPAASAAAFAKSGFSKLASSWSPFGALAGAGKPSLFGSAAPRGPSPFGSAGAPSAGAGASLGSTATAPKLSFGSTSAASPFATLNGSAAAAAGGAAFTSTFGPGFGGGGFGGARSLGGSSVLSGSRMTTFGKPGGSLKSDKPDRPFGAPESDEDDGDDLNEDDGNEGEKDDSSAKSGEDEGSREKEKAKHREEAKSCAEEKKKTKLHKVKVDDGEGDEVTLLSVRARMFYMEKGVGWKERGMGMLKINVPKASVDLDRRGNPDPSTFDPSSHEDDEALALSTSSSVAKREEDQDQEASSGGGTRKGVRLLMRQDQTLRVILNTTLMPTMKFQLTQRLKAALVLFTAFEGDNASQVQMKMSEANATSFMQLVGTIQERLAHV